MKFLIIAYIILFLGGVVKAQDNKATPGQELISPLVLPPLFEYPVVSDELPWGERSNWLVEHFWDNFDFKQKSVGQSQLLHAFRTYVVPMHLADKDVALKSVENLIKKLQKKPALLLQFTQAAERTIYDPQTAELLIDEVYLQFVKATVANKKIPDLKKARFKAQLKPLSNSLTGSKLPPFTYTDRTGKQLRYSSTGVPTIIEFGDFDCADCRIMRLRLETDNELQQLVNNGKATIYFISPDLDADSFPEWSNAVKNFPQNWQVGMSESLEDEIDLRTTPSLYLIDAEGNIVSKNASADAARAFVKNIEIQ